MKRSEINNTNYSETKSHDLRSLLKSSAQITITLDIFPSDIIKYVINLLDLAEKHVIRFVCKKFHSVAAKPQSELCSDVVRRAGDARGMGGHVLGQHPEDI
jgi:hypothetical protein